MQSQRSMTRRGFNKLTSLAAVSGMSWGTNWAAGADDKVSIRTAGTKDQNPIDVGTRKQLLIDNRFIAKSQGVSLRMNPPRKMGAVLEADRPWEAGWVGAYHGVAEDDGIYKMWYNATSENGRNGRLCYATSSDGVHWEKPSLDLVELAGSRDNNLVLGKSAEGAVYLDPIAPPEARFKLLVWRSVLGTSNHDGMLLVTSPDGLHWTKEYPVLPAVSDTQSEVFWDDRINKYVSYLRAYPPHDLQRAMVRCEIPKQDILKPWPYSSATEPVVISTIPRISTENLPLVIARDEKDPRHSSVYTPGVHKYPWAENAYFAFPSFFRHTVPDEAKPGDVPDSGVLQTQLLVSRNGISWARPDRRPYVPLGLVGEPDSHGIYMGMGMLRRGNWLYMYYGGFASGHEDPVYDDSALMLVTQRLDGFLSVEALWDGGEFTTPPLNVEGRRLQVNIETSVLGSLHVEVQDSAGSSIDGYTANDCDTIITNDVARTVTWRGKEDLPVNISDPVRLRFALRNAKLYAFQFVAS